ncbi:hypothetical protein L861_16430 [Litchfieldella anticariensis FP35 = DSM 16096]|uniref:Uncharacterized protein n=1 Tax=Litchfieldella anticariensis (strain DSM 16096 / CECT 5854 / CIP 108499 / LMG 22089 / FP35) TaxID=1121939 RepID=S2L1R9_LITA3|nr:hypothetical protein [Halomonas anticariensis]EPC01604.1 hypothetical protein L861_16430 [Halomonas anticariensis FP35 = DSM 16096]
MQVFSLEKMAEKIHYGKTKDYFGEVLSSYHNENYRSAVVMLWSVAVCDIVYKLQSLIDLYGDASARKILDEVSEIQKNDPKSSSWELKLVEDVCEKTNLLDTSEYENLRYLQKQRHLSAHPVLNKERELHSPNKETVRSLLRNTLDDLLTKPPFYTQHILNELLSDISESKEILNTRRKVKKYVVNRYFSRTTQAVEINIFRSLWKIVFKLENEKCDRNRLINLHVLEVIAKKNKVALPRAIQGDVDFYSNIANSGEPLSYLVFFLSKNSELYPLLNEAAKLKVEHCIVEDEVGKIVGWFVKESLEKHADDIEEWIEGDERPVFTPEQFENILEMSDSDEWQERFCRIVSTYYGTSMNYNQADSRFQVAIPNFIRLFNKNAIRDLAHKIESNSQCHDRRQARHDYAIIKERIDEIFGDGEFNYQDYYWFSRKLGLAD